MMNYKNIIFGSLREPLHIVWKNKLWITFLLLLELSLFVTLSVVSYTYLPKIAQHSKAITDYLSKLNLNEDIVAENLVQQKSILGDDPLLIGREYNEILRNVKLLLYWVFVSLVLFMSFGWAITNKIVHKMNLKQLLRLYFRILSIVLFYLGLIFLFFYSLLNISLFQLALEPSVIFAKYLLFLIVLLVFLYFMLISLSLVQKTGLKNLVQKTLEIGIKKIHYVLSIYFINILLLAISVALFYIFFESIFVLFISTILLIFSFVFGRILMINALERWD